MSTQTNLVLADGQSTPVNKTFSPRGADMHLAIWKDISAGIPIGFPSITLSNKENPSANGAYRVEGRIALPVLETISGDASGYIAQPKVAFKEFGKVEFVSPNRASAQNRKDLLAFMIGLLSSTVMRETFIDYDPPN